ncbi:MAG: TetR/AcrR family transcriptional regulator [Novosphingobium sp.]|nr:TetR/AcrR family transcriptional regulator [Novosphingobium sp.]
MKTAETAAGWSILPPGRETLYDPGRPITPAPSRAPATASVFRQNQRQRRAKILAATRSLLTERGLEGVTMRGIAENSGLAVQTIYNLVGPRDEAIVEAICEFWRDLGDSEVPDPDDPKAVIDVIDRWVESMAAAPDFCRQVCMIALSPSRGIFHKFRDRQSKAMRGFLASQQRRGIIRANVSTSDLAEQMVLLASALCLEWTDRRCSLDQVHRRLTTGFAYMLVGVLSPAIGPVYMTSQRSGDGAAR